MRTNRRPALPAAALTGALAGVAAAYAMTLFQKGLSSAGAAPTGSDDDPATVKAAQRVASLPIGRSDKGQAGEAVHYAFGAVLGLIYGAGSALIPAVAAGRGMPYGIAVALLADEMAVPAAGLSGPPSRSPASTHVYSLASHVVFGAALDVTRRILLTV